MGRLFVANKDWFLLTKIGQPANKDWLMANKEWPDVENEFQVSPCEPLREMSLPVTA